MMEMHDLCAIAAREPRCVLATAVKVEGHAYRKQGVSMLLTGEGEMYGSISPGCLESDLQARVERVLDTGQLEFVEYDMRPEDDLSWGGTIGCGGLIIVLLEPVCSELRAAMAHMHTCFQSGSAVEFTRSFYNRYTRIHYMIKLAGDAESRTSLRTSLIAKEGGAGMKAGPAFDEEHGTHHFDFTWNMDIEGGPKKAIESPQKPIDTLVTANTPRLSLVVIHPSESGSVASDFEKSDFQRDGLTEAERWDIPLLISAKYVPKPRLIIVGAGNDVIPVARLGQSAGFRVVVADWRETLCTTERFPGVELVRGFPHEIMPVLDIQSGDYIILMSHHFPREREFLELLEDRNYAYLGIMGSRTRTARLLNDLPPLKHLHSPVGLTIGADGPEEIAISIAAELIACKRAASAAENVYVQRGIVHATDGHSASSREEQPTGSG
ncbi:XdhC family protein [Paenibacillus pabuli]|uniref:XdhC family protein n=1 Tax=Paenibacillus pabuli TaxID=1472 RepID=UPI001FFFFB23|nr:XdhC/CoxI family protein [Paenibacillus pabuli]UPK46993.1 XdhC family protein [Paenibacillus pabuli]